MLNPLIYIHLIITISQQLERQRSKLTQWYTCNDCSKGYWLISDLNFVALACVTSELNMLEMVLLK